jgi:hypothetical protein
VVAVEVGPENSGEYELGIGRLPQEKVGESMFPRRPDDEVKIGHLGDVQAGGHRGLVDRSRVQTRRSQLSRSTSYLSPAAVVEGEHQVESVVAGGEFGSLSHMLTISVGDPWIIQVAGKTHSNSLAMKLVAPSSEQVFVEPHQEPDLLVVSVPVLG